ncbi:MAG: XdhC family protein [Pseudomonadota bacterium]
MQNILQAMDKETVPKALAMIVGQVGASYRPLGATMAIYEDGRHLGHVSSGCIEADIVAHALEANEMRTLTYGQGSPYLDLKLPCGGGMDILILPDPDVGVLNAAHSQLAARQPTALAVDTSTGALSLASTTQTGMNGSEFTLAMAPARKFFVFGNGHEAQAFAELVDGAGYPIELYSTNQDTLDDCRIPAKRQHHLVATKIPDPNLIDEWSSVTLFFHEHDLEEQILRDALGTPAFYIGAQGSMTTHMARLDGLRSHGVPDEDLARIRGPIGLIPKVRDPQTLAISVLAEIHKVALETDT